VRTPKACAKKQKLSNVFRTKCFWSAMRSRIAFIFAMPARYVPRSQAALLPKAVSGPSRSMSRLTHSYRSASMGSRLAAR